MLEMLLGMQRDMQHLTRRMMPTPSVSSKEIGDYEMRSRLFDVAVELIANKALCRLPTSRANSFVRR
jgi:hypothetical protein